MIIRDGSGNNYSAKVDNKNRLSVDAVTRTSLGDASEDGRLYTAGFDVTLTDANQSAVFYIENTGANDIEISDLNFGAGTMTGATGNTYKIQMYTDGTGLSSSTAVIPLNSNRGSAADLDATVLQGDTGATVTNGVAQGTLLFPHEDYVTLPVYFIIPKGQSLAFAITPATGNTSFNLTMYAQIYESRD